MKIKYFVIGLALVISSCQSSAVQIQPENQAQLIEEAKLSVANSLKDPNSAGFTPVFQDSRC